MGGYAQKLIKTVEEYSFVAGTIFGCIVGVNGWHIVALEQISIFFNFVMGVF